MITIQLFTYIHVANSHEPEPMYDVRVRELYGCVWPKSQAMLCAAPMKKGKKKNRINGLSRMVCMSFSLVGFFACVRVRLTEISYVIEPKSQLVATVYDCLKRYTYNENLPRERLHESENNNVNSVLAGDVCALHVWAFVGSNLVQRRRLGVRKAVKQYTQNSFVSCIPFGNNINNIEVVEIWHWLLRATNMHLPCLNNSEYDNTLSVIRFIHFVFFFVRSFLFFFWRSLHVAYSIRKRIHRTRTTFIRLFFAFFVADEKAEKRRKHENRIKFFGKQ